jgi:hypothetical protein
MTWGGSIEETCSFHFLKGSFCDGRRSPRILGLDVLDVRLGQKSLCGLAHQKNPSFRKWKHRLKMMGECCPTFFGTCIISTDNGNCWLNFKGCKKFRVSVLKRNLMNEHGRTRVSGEGVQFVRRRLNPAENAAHRKKGIHRKENSYARSSHRECSQNTPGRV